MKYRGGSINMVRIFKFGFERVLERMVMGFREDLVVFSWYF